MFADAPRTISDVFSGETCPGVEDSNAGLSVSIHTTDWVAKSCSLHDFERGLHEGTFLGGRPSSQIRLVFEENHGVIGSRKQYLNRHILL